MQFPKKIKRRSFLQGTTLLGGQLLTSRGVPAPNQAVVVDQTWAEDVGLSLDDFGTGYSSLSYLKRFPVDTVKIDRSFIEEIAIDSDDRAIVGAILSITEHLGLTAVAEGVETLQQRDLLYASGCQQLQGFLYSPPVPVDLATDLLGVGCLVPATDKEDAS